MIILLNLLKYKKTNFIFNHYGFSYDVKRFIEIIYAWEFWNAESQVRK